MKFERKSTSTERSSMYSKVCIDHCSFNTAKRTAFYAETSDTEGNIKAVCRYMNLRTDMRYIAILQLCLIWLGLPLAQSSQAQGNDLLGIGHKVVQLSNNLSECWGNGKIFLQIMHFAFQPKVFSVTDSIFVSIYDDSHRFVLRGERLFDDGKHWDIRPNDLVYGFVNRTERVFTREIETQILYSDSSGITIRGYSPDYFGGPPIPFLKYPVKGSVTTQPHVQFQWYPMVDDVDSGGIIIWDSKPTVEDIYDHIIHQKEIEVRNGSTTINISDLNLEQNKVYYWALWYFRGLRFFEGLAHFPGYSIELSAFSVGSNELTNVPMEFKLFPSYPNPFKQRTTMQWYQSHPASLQLTVYDLMGQQIRTLANEFAEAGMHQTFWDGTNERGDRVPSGSYFIVGEFLHKRSSYKVMLLN